MLPLLCILTAPSVKQMRRQGEEGASAQLPADNRRPSPVAMYLIPVLSMIGGLVALVAGGELLVRGASRLAAAVGVSPLVVGLTVVAFGTSSPELAVAVQAGFAGQADIAVGNIVGSNICNVLLILGVSALVAPLLVASQLVRLDVPLMIAASVLMGVLALDGVVGRIDGLLLFAILLAYIVWSIRQSRRESAKVKAEFEAEFGPAKRESPWAIARQLALIVAGLALLGAGANWLVGGATDIARLAGMSELLIGLTIVAVGTSLPEVAASVMASIKGERDIAVGNVVGSNLFNILCVLGLAAAVSPGGMPVSAGALRFDIPVMIVTAFACLPIFFTGHLIARWEGGLLLGYYVAYTTYLTLVATQSGLAKSFSVLVVGFVLPLTVITLLVASYRSWRKAPPG